jgi:hypothetical protein
MKLGLLIEVRLLAFLIIRTGWRLILSLTADRFTPGDGPTRRYWKRGMICLRTSE